ncbi:glycosyltransferase family A protein [Candidatus Pelagibacter sp. Uisw_136]|uniref:glycosyltransferase family A protein n=1 Tax=Candidatus Pelagibacter sp. Uisw_136 TaxID=3230991 RepID=UPI0039E7530D
MKNFCVSLTSIPPRFPTLEKTIRSINDQIKKPQKIFLNIPLKYKRYPDSKHNILRLEKIFKNLKIIRCKDYGPGTKLLGSLEYLMDYEYVILIDDDHIYNKDMLNIFNKEALKDLDRAYSFCVFNIEDCKVGQGADGFMINTHFLKGILEFFNKFVINNKRLFFNDDLWISIYLNKILKKDIINLFQLIEQPLFFKKIKSIYKKHTTIDALIELYSKDRGKARDIKFKENCEEYLLIKSQTKNFTKI